MREDLAEMIKKYKEEKENSSVNSNNAVLNIEKQPEVVQKVIVLDEKENKNIYFKNNTLIQTKYNLTSNENKMYLFFSYNLKQLADSMSNKTIEPGKSCTISFKRKDLKPLLKSDKYIQVNRLAQSFSKLRKKSIYIKGMNDSGNEYWGEYGFINSYRYIPDTDSFEVDMNLTVSELIMEHYLLSGGYTPINLEVISNLKSFAAQRIYELVRFRSWKKGKIYYTLEELKSYLGLENKKSYNLYGNLKNKVLNPAIEELNEKSIFEIRFEEEIGANKRVIGINFFVTDLEDRIYFKNQKKEYLLSTDNDNFFVPNSEIFTLGSLKLFKRDFKDKDFTNKEYEDLFYTAVARSLDKDKTDKIDVNTYKYFKATLIGMINDIEFKKGYENAFQVSLFD